MSNVRQDLWHAVFSARFQNSESVTEATAEASAAVAEHDKLFPPVQELEPGVLATFDPMPDYRKQLWVAVAAGVARAESCKHRVAPGEWANEALAAFDRAFPTESWRCGL